jgi:hypothetical protein
VTINRTVAMDFMQYPGIPALNALPKEERLDRFRAMHQRLMTNNQAYRLQNRRFLGWTGAAGVFYVVVLVSIAWAFSQGALSREWFRGILLLLGPILLLAVSWTAARHQRSKAAAIQQALEDEGLPGRT